MGLLFIDSFDHYATEHLPQKGWTPLGSVTISNGTGRRGGNALHLSDGGSATRGLASGVGTLIVGMAISLTAAADSVLLEFREGATVHAQVCLRSDGKLEAKRNGVSLGISANALISPGSFHYLEVKATIHDSTGEILVKVDSATVLSVTAADTRNGGSGLIDAVRLAASGLEMLVDDFILADTAGAANNDFLGDVRIDVLSPNGAGTHQDFVPSTGTEHWALIDEVVPSNGTDALIGGGAGSKDTSTLTSLPASGTVFGIQVNNNVAKSSAGTCTVRNLIRSGSSEANGTSSDPATTYGYLSSIHETDPATGSAWTAGAVDAMQAGLEVIA